MADLASLKGCSAGALYYEWLIRPTVKPVSSDHKNKTYFWLFRQVVAYCCMKVSLKTGFLVWFDA